MSCSRRGEETACAYSNGCAHGRDRRGENPRDSEAQRRLQKLEEMVTGLMRATKEDLESRRDKTSPQVAMADQGFNNPSPPISDSTPEAQLNIIVPDRDYVSATHWTAILDNVCLPHGKKIFQYVSD